VQAKRVVCVSLPRQPELLKRERLSLALFSPANRAGRRGSQFRPVTFEKEGIHEVK
jgi:hypothetical protein